MKKVVYVGVVLVAMLLGSVVATFSQSPAITGLSLANGVLNVTFAGGELQTAPAITGPWTGSGNSSGQYSEPVAGGTNKFYRVRGQSVGPLTISNINPATYTVQYNALAVGQPVYVDRDYTFSGVASLGGSTYIKTANDDKTSTGSSFLTFDVNQNVRVYVAHDDREFPKPAWLSAFTDTGENLVGDTTLSLFVKEFAAGTVTLGGNGFGSDWYSMYSVVVTPVPAAPPGQASNPNPAHSATGVSAHASLSWTAGSGALSHDVYFGTANPPAFQGNQAGSTYNPGTLSAFTTYYWRINEKNSAGTTTGTVWSFTTGPAAPLTISSISPATYTVQYDSLAVDQLVYVDRTTTFDGVASLGGSTYIKTANDDKLSTANPFLTFNVSANVVVYVAHDDRISPKPAWLSAFTDTGEDLVTDTTLSLYYKEFAAGTVTLGGNEDTGDNSMYSVVVTLAPTAPPAPASNPNPASGATGVSASPSLSWTSGSGAFSRDVYFGTANPPAFQGNQAAKTYNPGTLSAYTTYYWRIDEKNSVGTTTGTVWSFTTGAVVAPTEILANDDCCTRDGANYNAYGNELGLMVKYSGDASWIEFTLGNVAANQAVLTLMQADNDVANPWTIVVRGAEYNFNETTFTGTSTAGWTLIGSIPNVQADNTSHTLDITTFYNTNLGKTVTLNLYRDVQPDGSGPIFADREGTRPDTSASNGPRINIQ
jgi:hypothetical protein